MVLTCQWNNSYVPRPGDWTLEDIEIWSLRGVLDSYSKCEDYASQQSELWVWGWNYYMNRLAPVQLVEDWDPGEFFKLYLESCNIREFETYQKESIWFIENKSLIVYRPGPESSTMLGGLTTAPKSLHDADRFKRVLDLTIQLAIKEWRGLLFFGQKGWNYTMEVPASVQPIMARSGFKFITRHQ